ncbi:hypothetical protein M752DRAFT_277105 [Aspergillus phoenicis ATCC 13157]|uniref:Transcription factor domain-containing protein n=1 Tax=Aspergillus phoenicis ATCC 13157 TaxID=1353007 RepID=A0A370PFP6_ASPPH|nr:hypothetical protein M752DRAFT_277105 [Aspergillus phoenicis ATCC 13157]
MRKDPYVPTVSVLSETKFMRPAPLTHASCRVSRDTATVSAAVVSPTGTSTAQQPSNISEDAPVNMLHIELLHNLYFEAIKELDRPKSFSGVSIHDILRYGHDAPYLINELLSLSALHLSIVSPEQHDFYRDLSTQLQNHALSSFNTLSDQIRDESYVPIFLFAGFLGLHMLCETLVCRGNDFESFINRFVQYVVLHHGVRTVAGQGRWQLLQQTALKPLLELGERIPSPNKTLGPTCQVLLDRIQGLDLDESTTRVYQQAVQA